MQDAVHSFVPYPTTFDDMMIAIETIDARNLQRLALRRDQNRDVFARNPSRNYPQNGSNRSQASPDRTPGPSTTAPPSTARSFDSRKREPLTEEEKARRKRLGLCPYCGNSGHILEDCPAKNAVALQ